MTNTKHTGYNPPYIDDEEKEIIESLHKHISKITHDKSKKNIQKDWSLAVKKTKKTKPISMRLQEKDIDLIKIEATQKGLKYQTLLSSVIHQYTTGRLISVN